MLGTGAPTPRPDRFGPSTLIEAGDQKLLIDAGRGAAIRLYQLNVPLRQLDALLLTHYHSDHTSGIPDVWLTGWLTSHFGTRTKPFRVIGPVGAKLLMENLERAYALDIKIRIADEKLPPSGVAVHVEEFDNDGVVYEKNGVKVIAFEVDHGDMIKPAYGYRIEYGGRIVVISGDTRYNQNVIKCATSADLLVHEVAAARSQLPTSSCSPASEYRRRRSMMSWPRPGTAMTGRLKWARTSCLSTSATPSPSAGRSARTDCFPLGARRPASASSPSGSSRASFSGHRTSSRVARWR